MREQAQRVERVGQQRAPTGPYTYVCFPAQRMVRSLAAPNNCRFSAPAAFHNSFDSKRHLQVPQVVK